MPRSWNGGVMASMDDIARQAGVGIGTLYRHFPSRDDLILALVADDLERLAARADELRDRRRRRRRRAVVAAS